MTVGDQKLPRVYIPFNTLYICIIWIRNILLYMNFQYLYNIIHIICYGKQYPVNLLLPGVQCQTKQSTNDRYYPQCRFKNFLRRLQI